MCGIAGWVEPGRDLGDAAAAVVDAMAETMRGRGPDGAGAWVSLGAALAHRRLAVIDPPGGRQPMTVETPDGPVTIVYSGEVYNHYDLRRELVGRGARFTTSSDTEVVLQSYLQWGTDAVSRFNGMFALAIWDARRERLLLARDRLGVKPLYLMPLRNGLLFASEPKAILAHPEVRPVVDLDGMRAALGYTLTIPGVPWAGMAELEPGTVLTLERGKKSTWVYWELPTYEHVDDQATTVARVRELLADTARRQLVADVPVGVLLSGGLDSSTLTALAAADRETAGDEPIATYDLAFTGYADHFVPDLERAAPDPPFVDEVVGHLGTRHRRIELEPGAVADPALRRAAVRAFDVPPGSGDRDRSMLVLFRAIRETATVALSGEAADELFGGYSWFHDPAAQQADAFGWVTSCYDTYRPAPGALRPELESKVDLPGYVADSFAAAAARVDHLDGADELERRMRVASYVHLTASLRVLLDRKDRLSMATGLEVRVPYCDHRLVEFVYNAPWALKAFDGREKSLLRAAARDLLPDSVVGRVKTAYPSTQHPGYLEALRGQVAALAAEPDHAVFEIVDRSWLQGFAQRDAGAATGNDRHTADWILNLATWLDDHQPLLRLP